MNTTKGNAPRHINGKGPATQGSAELWKSRTKRRGLRKGKFHRKLAQQDHVVLYELRNSTSRSRKICLGYLLVILSPSTSRFEHQWQYETYEERWARAGFQTLVDAQARQKLDDRRQWKPYKGVPRPDVGSGSNLCVGQMIITASAQIQSWAI